MASITSYQLFVGIDVAAATFTAVWATDLTILPRATTFDQSSAGYTDLLQRLQTTGIPPAQALVVLEATGSYWVTLAVTFHEAGYRVSVVNPQQVAQYARSLPRRGKTDGLDAQLLTRFAYERQPAAWTPPPQVYHELHQRLVARDGLVTMRQQARNQRHALLQWPVVISAVQAQLEAVIADLDARIATLEQEINVLLRDGAWAKSATLLIGIPGIGVLTAAWLLVGTLNFELCPSPAQATAYVGLAPLPRQSGTSVRGRSRIGHGGHARVRTALYLATLNAARFNAPVKAFYDRLRAAGKPGCPLGQGGALCGSGCPQGEAVTPSVGRGYQGAAVRSGL